MALTDNYWDFFEVLQQQCLLPIVRLSDPLLCRRYCRELYAAGFGILEVTLTTPDALKIIEGLADKGICTGAGTVTTPEEANLAIAHGASFLVSPGLNLEIAKVTADAGMPYIPGIYTPSEVMQALAADLTCLKLFPAMPAGPEYLKHLKGPFPQAQWIPTGGIAFESIPAYLKLGALAVGQGTRLVQADVLQAGDWKAVRQQLKSALAQVQSWKKSM